MLCWGEHPPELYHVTRPLDSDVGQFAAAGERRSATSGRLFGHPGPPPRIDPLMEAP